MRGKILREPSAAAPGLVAANGQQYEFMLERIWKSASPATTGATVEIEFDQNEAITGISLVSQDQLTKEQTELAIAAAKEKGAALANGLVAKFGLPTLVTLGVLVVSWFFLTAVSYNAGFLGKVDFTFWKILKFVNAGNPMEALRNLGGDGGSAGIYGICAVIALAGPFASYFWKDKRAILGGTLPLLFMVAVGLIVNHTLSSLGGSGGGFFSARDVEEMRDEVMKGISIGVGTYLSVGAALYLAFVSARKFLTARA